MLYLIYLSGIVWLLPVGHMIPAVRRIVRHTNTRCDLLAPAVLFFALSMILFCVRWALFHGQVPDMGRYEIAMWSGCYTLSIASALLFTVAWRIVRRVV